MRHTRGNASLSAADRKVKSLRRRWKRLNREEKRAEIFDLLGLGHSRRQLAARLGLTEGAVRYHVRPSLDRRPGGAKPPQERSTGFIRETSPAVLPCPRSGSNPNVDHIVRFFQQQERNPIGIPYLETLFRETRRIVEDGKQLLPVERVAALRILPLPDIIRTLKPTCEPDDSPSWTNVMSEWLAMWTFVTIPDPVVRLSALKNAEQYLVELSRNKSKC